MNEITTSNTALQATGAQVLTADLYTRYIDFLDASPKTVETYNRAIRQLRGWLTAHGITQPTRDDLIAYREELKTDHKPATVQNYITAIRLFFTWLEQAGLYPNIAEHLKGAKLDKEHKKDYLTGAQAYNVLEGIDTSTAQGRRDYAIALLMVTGGLRDIEVHRANVEDLRTLGDTSVLYLQGKGREERAEFVILPPEVERAIRATFKDRTDATGRAPLFISLSNNSKGGRISTRSISGIIKRSMINAGYNSDRLTAHSLRHTAVNLALLDGKSIEEVQQFARHKNIATTMIYANHLDKMKNQCSNSVFDAIYAGV